MEILAKAGSRDGEEGQKNESVRTFCLFVPLSHISDSLAWFTHAMQMQGQTQAMFTRNANTSNLVIQSSHSPIPAFRK